MSRMYIVSPLIYLIRRVKRKWKWSRSVMSNSLGPHGLWPTRLLRSWYFPGKSTGVGCHFLLQGNRYTFAQKLIKSYIFLQKWKSEVAQSCQTLCDPMDGSLPGSAVHGIFHARILDWACHFFLQIIFTVHVIFHSCLTLSHLLW